uniref:Uncharacterized protein n=1 Tax=viral metagenome TaxID=1070528 RepID=A0A6C0IV99_9ZZZZ
MTIHKFIIFFFILILLYFIFKPKNIENFSNLISNSDFKDGSFGSFTSNNIGSNYGHTIIKLLNPGESSYVLQQDKNSDGYKITSSIMPNTTYKLSVWLAYSIDWDGAKNLFKITQSKKTDKNTDIIHGGDLVESKTVNNLVWMKKEYTFTTSSDSDNRIEITIGFQPKSTVGFRYFTNITLQKFYHLLDKLPIKSGLMMFLSGHHSESLKNETLVWKDISMNANDLHFEKSITKNDSNSLILDNLGKLSSSNTLIPDENNFVIIWTGIFDEYSEGSFLEFDANNDYNKGLKIYYKNNIGVDNKIVIEIGKNKITYDIGIIQKYTQYALLKNETKLYLYIDGYNIVGDSQPILDYAINFNSNPVIFNGDKTLKGNIDFLLVYTNQITKDNIIDIKSYIHNYKINDKVLETPNICKKTINTKNIDNGIENYDDDNINNNNNNNNNNTNNNGNYNKIIEEEIESEEEESTIVKNSNQNLTQNIKYCPFDISKRNNPCFSSECNNNDFLNCDDSKCNKVVNSYCKENKDPYCEVINNKCNSSQEVLNSLEKQNNSSINTNKIINSTTNQINMKDYIKKDKIPCWGCNLK